MTRHAIVRLISVQFHLVTNFVRSRARIFFLQLRTEILFFFLLQLRADMFSSAPHRYFLRLRADIFLLQLRTDIFFLHLRADIFPSSASHRYFFFFSSTQICFLRLRTDIFSSSTPRRYFFGSAQIFFPDPFRYFFLRLRTDIFPSATHRFFFFLSRLQHVINDLASTNILFPLDRPGRIIPHRHTDDDDSFSRQQYFVRSCTTKRGTMTAN